MTQARVMAETLRIIMQAAQDAHIHVRLVASEKYQKRYPSGSFVIKPMDHGGEWWVCEGTK